jgi:hypothetical protein
MNQSRSWEPKSLNQSINFPPFMKPDVSLSYSQDPVNGPFPEPINSFRNLLLYCLQIHLNIISSMLRPTDCSPPIKISDQAFVWISHRPPMRATRFAYPFVIITSIIFSLYSRTYEVPHYSLHQPPSTSSLLGSNTPQHPVLKHYQSNSFS